MLTLVACTILYFLPTILGRHKSDAIGIFLVNLLLGWTVIGWFVALFWALSGEPRVAFRSSPVSGGRFCSQCGTLAPAAAHFCSACGRAVV